MANYDAAIIQKFCDQLYSKAGRVTWLLVFLALILGVIGGGLLASAFQNDGTRGGVFFGILVFSTMIGYGIGQHLAFKYRLQAQMTFVQLEIEKNTRRISG